MKHFVIVAIQPVCLKTELREELLVKSGASVPLTQAGTARGLKSLRCRILCITSEPHIPPSWMSLTQKVGLKALSLPS